MRRGRFLTKITLVILLTAVFALSTNVMAADGQLSELSSYFTAQKGTPEIYTGQVIEFNNIVDDKLNGIVYTENLTGAYTVQFDAFTNSGGGGVFLFSLGNKSITGVGGDAQISKTDVLTMVVTVGAVGSGRAVAYSASGHYVYNSPGYDAVTDPIKLANTCAYFTTNQPIRMKLDVKENGDVDVYAFGFVTGVYVPQYVYTISKGVGGINNGETDGYFSLISATTAGVKFGNFYINGIKASSDYENDNSWNLFGTAYSTGKIPASMYVYDNERVVSDFYIDDSGLEQGETIFDITYRIQPLGTHGWTSGGWLTMGLMFGMPEKTSEKNVSCAIETQWATLLRLNMDGTTLTKSSGDGTGAASAYFVNSVQAIFRLVGKKGGNLDIYVTEGGGALTSTIYQSYEGLRFNGYMAFDVFDNIAHNEPIIFKDLSVNVSESAMVLPVNGISLDKATAEIGVGGQLQLNTIFSPANATNKNVTFSSSNESVATVDSSGNITAIAKGTATITVTTEDGGLTATCELTVNEPVAGVTLDKADAIVNVGGTVSLTATVLPAGADNKNVTFSSSNQGVATVNSNGVITAIAKGTAIITVTTADGGFTATCEVTVNQPVTGVILDKESATVNAGGTVSLTATVIPVNATNAGVTFSSSDESVATVDNDGKVTAVSIGIATITVTTADGEFTATCEVTVVVNPTGCGCNGTFSNTMNSLVFTLIILGLFVVVAGIKRKKYSK